jgi:hypothetical protein
MDSQADIERAQDLERRIHTYEEMENTNNWPGALTATDYIAMIVMKVVSVISFYLWGY